MTNAQRQALYKAKQAAAGIKEVRGIMSHTDHHPAIRAAARKHIKRLSNEK